MDWSKEYPYKYDIDVHFHIPSDDRNDLVSTKLHLYSTYHLVKLDREHNRSVNVQHIGGERYPMVTNNYDNTILRISCRHVGGYSKGDPLITEARKTLQHILGMNVRQNYWSSAKAPEQYKLLFVLPDSGNIPIMVEKGKTYYKLMNQRIKKDNLLYTISRYLFRACSEKDGVKLLTFLMGMLELPENINYVLENRVPYHFFDSNTRTKVHCRMNANLIGVDEVAIEVSDGIWGSLSVSELDTMVNTFYHGHKRSVRWNNCSPRTLWTRTMGEEPTESQLDLMKEFLVQNRTKDLIENRAKELMDSLVVKYPDRINIIDNSYPLNTSGTKVASQKIMFVAGKMCDWAIVEKQGSETQKVRVYVWKDDTWSGSICIDNIHSNSSLGDQFAARALALLNDNLTVKLVHTISRHINEDVLSGEKESRCFIPLTELDKDSMNWKEAFN